MEDTSYNKKRSTKQVTDINVRFFYIISITENTYLLSNFSNLLFYQDLHKAKENKEKPFTKKEENDLKPKTSAIAGRWCSEFSWRRCRKDLSAHGR